MGNVIMVWIPTRQREWRC